jgi:hypothetical protein
MAQLITYVWGITAIFLSAKPLQFLDSWFELFADYWRIRNPRRVPWRPMFLPHCCPFLEAFTGQYETLLPIPSVHGIQRNHQFGGPCFDGIE